MKKVVITEPKVGQKRTHWQAMGVQERCAGEILVDSGLPWAKLNSITKNTVSGTKIKSAEFGIGRHPANDLHILDARLSGYHCRISRENDPHTGAMQVFLHDLSTNGTYKNGEQVNKNGVSWLQICPFWRPIC